MSNTPRTPHDFDPPLDWIDAYDPSQDLDPYIRGWDAAVSLMTNTEGNYNYAARFSYPQPGMAADYFHGWNAARSLADIRDQETPYETPRAVARRRAALRRLK